MSKAIPLMEFVPVYKFNESPKKESPPQNHQSDWVDRLKEQGDEGEQLVKQFLEERYNAIVEPQKDSAGYDFKVFIDGTLFFVEVKTTRNERNSFFISYNEIKASKSKGESYYLYFVRLNNDTPTLHIIINPFETLALRKMFETTDSNDLASMKISSLEVQLTDLSKLIAVKNFC